MFWVLVIVISSHLEWIRESESTSGYASKMPTTEAICALLALGALFFCIGGDIKELIRK